MLSTGTLPNVASANSASEIKPEQKPPLSPSKITQNSNPEVILEVKPSGLLSRPPMEPLALDEEPPPRSSTCARIMTRLTPSPWLREKIFKGAKFIREDILSLYLAYPVPENNTQRLSNAVTIIVQIYASIIAGEAAYSKAPIRELSIIFGAGAYYITSKGFGKACDSFTFIIKFKDQFVSMHQLIAQMKKANTDLIKRVCYLEERSTEHSDSLTNLKFKVSSHAEESETLKAQVNVAKAQTHAVGLLFKRHSNSGLTPELAPETPTDEFLLDSEALSLSPSPLSP